MLKRYLTGRKQYIEIVDIKISYDNLYYGVPQGTILLINIYLNDFLNLKTEGTVKGFADDTAIFY